MQFISTVIFFAFAGITLCAPPLYGVLPYRNINFDSGFDLAGKIESGQFAAVADPSANDRKNFGDSAPLLASSPLKPINEETRGGSGNESNASDLETTVDNGDVVESTLELPSAPIEIKRAPFEVAALDAAGNNGANDEFHASDNSGATKQSTMLEMPAADIRTATSREEAQIGKDVEPNEAAPDATVEERPTTREATIKQSNKSTPMQKANENPNAKKGGRPKKPDDDAVLARAMKLAALERKALAAAKKQEIKFPTVEPEHLVREAAFWAMMRKERVKDMERFISSEPSASDLFDFIRDTFQRDDKISFPLKTNELMTRIKPLLKKSKLGFPAAAAFAFNIQVILMETMKGVLPAAERAVNAVEVRCNLIKAAYRDNDKEMLERFATVDDFSSLMDAGLITAKMVAFENRAEHYQKLFPDFKLPDYYPEFKSRFQQVGDRISALAEDIQKYNL